MSDISLYYSSIRNNYFKLNEFRDEDIFRYSLGTQSLQIIDADFISLISKIETLLDEDNSLISLKTVQNIDRIINEIVIVFIRIKSFSDIDFVAKRSGTLHDLQKLFDDFKDLWQGIGWIFEKHFVDESLDEQLQKTQQLNLKLQTDISEVQTLKNSLEQQAEEYKTRYNEINTNVELEIQINVFEAQAKKNKDDSVKWLWGSIVAGAILLITLISIYCNFGMPAQAATKYTSYNNVCETCGEHSLWVDMLRHLFFKLLILSAEIYILSFCVKNYNACMHNKTNNEHRHNSFAAALHFYNTTTSDKRDEILIKVADAIFTHQKSGYYGKDSEPSNPSIIQSVIEKVADKG